MGLFSNKKKPCPICGNPTPRLFAQEFEGQPICKQCQKEIDLPSEVLDSMTLEGFRQYLEDYRENQKLWPLFQPGYHYTFGYDPLVLDEGNGLIRLKQKDSGWVLEKKCLKSFRIFEDDNILFESGNGTLICHPSGIPDRAEALEPIVSAFCLERKAYERNEELERNKNRNETDEQRRERERISETYRPRFEDPNLFWGFSIELTFDHPYWASFSGSDQGPVFDRDYPSVKDYMKSYCEQTEKLHLLAVKLMHMIDPDAGETKIGEAEAAEVREETKTPADVATEIAQYKGMLEQGLITEEEFTAKKRQLLGI